jgi:hypothetical protein
MATKKLIEQINRIKSLFTEERLYGNLVEQKEELDNIGRNGIIGTTDNIKLIKVTNSKFKIKPNGDVNLFKYKGEQVFPDTFILPDVKSIFSSKIGLDLDKYKIIFNKERDAGRKDVLVFTITLKTKEPVTPTANTNKKEPESTTVDAPKKEPVVSPEVKKDEPVSPTADTTKKEPAVKYGGGSLAGKPFSTDDYSVKKINTPLQSGFEYYVNNDSKDVYKVKNNKIDTVYKFNESFNINLLYKNVLNEDWSKINEAYYTVGNSDKKMSDKFFNIAQKALTSTETDNSDTKELEPKDTIKGDVNVEIPIDKSDSKKPLLNVNWKDYPCVTNNKKLIKSLNPKGIYQYYDKENQLTYYPNGTAWSSKLKIFDKYSCNDLGSVQF